MQFDVALYDLIAPYVLRGAPLGPIHAAVSAIRVHEFTTAASPVATVVRGVAKLSGDVDAYFDPTTGAIGIDAQNTEGHPRDDGARRDPWIDIRDTAINFELTAPREASGIIAAGAVSLNPGSDAAVIALLGGLDAIPADAPPSDYPSTRFTLDMVITGAVLRPPFLKPADLLPDGRLAPRPTTAPAVAITLPRFKLRLSQGSVPGSPLDLSMLSFGAGGLDDPSDLEVAQLIEMDPPYAFIGDDHTVGIGFRSATLDLSDSFTPPAVLEQFGFDESWTGLYLPEIRLFVAPNGLEDFAVSAGASNLLIGWGAQGGVTGDFELAVIDQGAGELVVGARFVDATGRAYGITMAADGTAMAAVPARCRLIVDVRGGRPPYTVTADVGAGASPGRVFDIDMGADTQRQVSISVTDSRAPALNKSLAITLSRYAPQLKVTPGGPIKDVEIVSQSTQRGGAPATSPVLRIISQTTTHVTVGLNPPNGETDWTGDVSANDQAAVAIPIAGNEMRNVVATINASSQPITLTSYFNFDQPKPGRNDIDEYSINSNNSHTAPAVDETPSSGWTGGAAVIPTHEATLSSVPAGTQINITGVASYEGEDSNQQKRHNYQLSRNRADAFRKLIEDRFPSRFTFATGPQPPLATSGVPPPDAAWVTDWKTHTAPRNTWWKAVAQIPATPLPATVTTAQLRRPPSTEPRTEVIPDTPPADPAPPSWFRSAKLKVRIVRNSFVALEISGEVDFETAVEERVRDGGVGANQVPELSGLGAQNPADGIVQYKLLVQIDDASQTKIVSVALGADPADTDGLVMTGARRGAPPVTPSLGRDMLGITTAMTPVLAANAPANPLAGDIADLALAGITLGIPMTLAALDMITVERVVLFGGELVVRDRTSGPEISLLFDVETALSVNIKLGDFTIIEIPRDSPLAIRYKAIGLRLGYTPPETRFQFRPIFDSSKGYTIDVSGPGGIRVADPLGKIIKVLAARLARTNPLTFEIDLGFAVDLGVVTFERARVRMSLDPVGPPEISALAASIDIPGAVRARGYVEIGSRDLPSPPGAKASVIAGGLDLTIVPIKLRVRAEIEVAQIPANAGGPATGVIVSLEVTFPAPIPLGNSGLGLVGLLGLFAMHYARNDAPFANDATPALSWLNATGGEPTRLKDPNDPSKVFWAPRVNSWAFGVGAVLGTMEGGTVFNLKGIFLLELPGPRVLLMMKASLLTPPPPVKGVGGGVGSILAVIDLDIGRGTMTIGIIAQYAVEPLFKIRIPVEAFFNLHQGNDWHIFLGKVSDPVQAKVINVFDGSGYLMISGNGIQGAGNLPSIPSGLALAAGLHVELIWGNKQIRIYASVAGGFDAVMAIKPFFLAGKLYLRGELRLVVVSISAYAGLDLRVGTDPATKREIARLDGQICGEVDLFFFSIKGCVSFGLGQNPSPPLPPLIDRVLLVNRSPALAVGTGADSPIDGVIGEAVVSPAAPDINSLKPVPIDCIPAITFTAAPKAQGGTALGNTLSDAPGSSPAGFVDRAGTKVKYKVTSVSFSQGALNAGNTPAVWWSHSPANQPNSLVQLALLTWAPTPTPTAVERSEHLEETITDRWGTVCKDAAEAAAVLWTFNHEPFGPSASGWRLQGTAWPDLPNVMRSGVPDLELFVDESWRSGAPQADSWRGIIPARVEGRMIDCPPHGGFAARAITAVPLKADVEMKRAMAAFTVGEMATDLAVTPLSAGDMIRNMQLGLALPRQALPSLLAGTDQVFVEAGPKQCPARALAAPMLDEGAIVAFGDQSREPLIKDIWKLTGFRPSPLADAVRLHTHGFADGRVLLAVRRSHVADGLLVLRIVNDHREELHRITVEASDFLPPKAVPPRWVEAAGPWLEEITHAIQFVPGLIIGETGYLLALVDLTKMPEADHVEIGLDLSKVQPGQRVEGLAGAFDPNMSPQEQAKNRQLRRPYYVLAVELTRWAEVQRQDFDQHLIQSDRDMLEGYLGLQSGNYALFKPNTLYGLKVDWKEEREGSTATDQSANYWFRTTAEPPAKLGPYMLFTLPGERETQVFGEEPVKLVFATPQVANLFDAFGRMLQVKLRAASFRRPQPSQLPPGESYPFLLTQDKLHMLPAMVLTPFEDALQDVLQGQCIPVEGERIRHSERTIRIPLDPYTDYILDIESVPKGQPDSADRKIVHSVPFSTGAFATLDTFAMAIMQVSEDHRFTASGAMQAISSLFASRQPEGSDLDKAFAAHGFEPMPVAKDPRLVVFWEQANPAALPQPAAILIDAPEPMRRQWKVPTKVTDTAADPPSERYELVAQTWLDLDQGQATPGRVQRIVMAPGSQRALVVMNAGMRGQRVSVDLVRRQLAAHFVDPPGTLDRRMPVCDVVLNRAPWEE
jgi:large repetitive protein